jgi:uncharacterized membrane protein
MAKEPFEYKLDILIKEWDHLQQHIGRFDTIIFVLRGFIVSVLTAMLSASASTKYPDLMLFAMLPVLLFWFVDALHKSFQRRFILRTRELENYLSGKTFLEDLDARTISFHSPAISAGFGKGKFLSRLSYVMKTTMLRNVAVVYVSMLIFCAIAYMAISLAVGQGSNSNSALSRPAQTQALEVMSSNRFGYLRERHPVTELRER